LRKIKRLVNNGSKAGKALYKDSCNVIRYGASAPMFAERIWIDHRNCNLALHKITAPCGKELGGRTHSGKIIDFPWPTDKIVSLNELPKFKACMDHWVNNMPWEQTGICDYMLKLIEERGKVDGCIDLNDVIRRYDELDKVFEQVKKDRRIKTKKEINPYNFREKGGILINIGPEGDLFLEGGGVHRFAIAKILEIPFPAQIGCVHVSAIPYLNNYREKLKNINN
jgi:hypothetical protein